MWNKLKKKFNKFIYERVIQHIQYNPEDAMYMWDILHEIYEKCNEDSIPIFKSKYKIYASSNKE